jgi:hypothetical protein
MNALPALLAAVALASAVAAQQLAQLPDNHTLSKSATQNHAGGTTNYWGLASTTGRRFQVLYDASHFTGVQGVTGPMTIQHLRFRGEDSEHNVGGQTYTGVTVNVYKTTLASAAALSTTFATNLAPLAPATTTLIGTLSLPTLTVGASLGRSPNNDIIDLDFSAGPAVVFDPSGGSGAEVNLLVDVSYTGAAAATDPQASTMVAIQDTAGAVAFVRGRAVYAASAAAATGTASALPPTMRVEYAGSGGFTALTPARNERYGAACGGSPSSFYQLFASHQYFDLKDPGQVDGLSGLRMIPDVYPNPNTYTVTGGAAAVDLANGLLPAATRVQDDATFAHALPAGAAFSYPGGPAGGSSAFRPSTNGYIIVDPTSTETASDFSPTVLEFLGSAATHQARFAPFWHDLSPNKNAPPLAFADPQSGLHVVNHVAGNEVLVTWYRVGRFNSVAQVFQESHTMQASFNWVTGVVEFRYGPMDELWADTFSGQVSGIVGFSRGRIGGTTSSVDPQSRDLSIERPFSTSVEGTASNMGLSAVSAPIASGPIYGGRGFVGQSLTWNVTNVPAGTFVGAQLVDINNTRPGLQLPGITAPGCMLSTSTGASLFEVNVLPAASVTGTVPLAIPGGYQPALMGFAVHAQYVVLDGLFGGPNLITSSSNAIRHTIGLN